MQVSNFALPILVRIARCSGALHWQLVLLDPVSWLHVVGRGLWLHNIAFQTDLNDVAELSPGIFIRAHDIDKGMGWLLTKIVNRLVAGPHEAVLIHLLNNYRELHSRCLEDTGLT